MQASIKQAAILFLFLSASLTRTISKWWAVSIAFPTYPIWKKAILIFDFFFLIWYCIFPHTYLTTEIKIYQLDSSSRKHLPGDLFANRRMSTSSVKCNVTTRCYMSKELCWGIFVYKTLYKCWCSTVSTKECNSYELRISIHSFVAVTSV